MNIFILDEDLFKSAEMLCDQHLNKQILELAQLICTVLHDVEPDKESIPYKATHVNHPVTKWCKNNLKFCIDYIEILSYEYTQRFKKRHLSYTKLINSGVMRLYDFPQSEYKIDDFPIKNDRELVKNKINDWKIRENKRKLVARWTNRTEPEWLTL